MKERLPRTAHITKVLAQRLQLAVVCGPPPTVPTSPELYQFNIIEALTDISIGIIDTLRTLARCLGARSLQINVQD
jgi:hypothetical protein